MVRCKWIQVRSASTCGCYWSSIEALFHKAERCRQNFIGPAAVPQDRVKNVFETTDYAFPNISMVRSTRSVKVPPNSFLQECVVEDLLVLTADFVPVLFRWLRSLCRCQTKLRMGYPGRRKIFQFPSRSYSCPCWRPLRNGQHES